MNKTIGLLVALGIIVSSIYLVVDVGKKEEKKAELKKEQQEASVPKKYKNYIYYFCADWGPNSDDEEKDEEKGKEFEEKIYCVKQILSYEDEKLIANGMYLCSMNPDGSDKKEIAPLWENNGVEMPIGGGSMDICLKTKQAAVVFSVAPKEWGGVWVINFDGTGVKHLVEMPWDKDFRARIEYPSFFPDGEHLVYHEKWLHTKDIQYQIVKVDKNGENKTYLTGTEDGRRNKFPAVSRDGKNIVYTHTIYQSDPDFNIQGETGLYIMDSEGKNKRLLYTNEVHYADYPEWSPDGKQLYVMRSTNRFVFVEAESGKELLAKQLVINKEVIFPTRMHWGKYGYMLGNGGAIRIINHNAEWETDAGLKPYQTRGRFIYRLYSGYTQSKDKDDLRQANYRWEIKAQ